MKYNIRLHSPQLGGWTVQSDDKKTYVFCREVVIEKPTQTELYKNQTGQTIQGSLTVEIEENEELKIINNVLYIK